MGISVEPPGPADPVTPSASVTAFGSVTSIGAGAAVATTAALAAGIWQIAVQFNFEGSSASGDAQNLELKVGATVITTYPNSDASEGLQTFAPINVTIPGGGSVVSLNAIAAGTVGVLYVGLIVATKVG